MSTSYKVKIYYFIFNILCSNIFVLYIIIFSTFMIVMHIFLIINKLFFPKNLLIKKVISLILFDNYAVINLLLRIIICVFIISFFNLYREIYLPLLNCKANKDDFLFSRFFFFTMLIFI